MKRRLRKPKRSKRRSCRRFAFEALAPRLLLDAKVIISEFLADNDDTLLDGDGASSDWIELHNEGPDPVSLLGWRLTDDPNELSKWPLPDVTLQADEYLLVFASGQTTTDYRDASGFWHTNFQLNSAGDYLALSDPQLTVVSQFNAADGTFPPQREDISFGVGAPVEETVLVGLGAAAKTLVPQDETLAGAWTGGEEPFDDSAAAGWETAATGIGFDSTLVHTPTPRLHWNAAFPASGNAWEATLGAERTWSFNSTPPLVDAQGDWPGITQAYQFGGSQSATSSSYQGIGDTGSATFELWFKPSGLDGGDQVLWETGGVNGASLTLNNQLLRFGTSNTSENPTSRSITYGLTADEISTFVQVLGVIDRPAGQTRMYVNGELVPGTVSSVTGDWSGVNNAGLGGEASNATGGFASGAEQGHGRYLGQIALFSYFDAALNDQQVKDLFVAVTEVDYHPWINADLGDSMRGLSSSAFVRIPFPVQATAEFDQLLLQMQYDDGFVAYLNGQEVARANAPADLRFDASATAERSDQDAVRPAAFDLSQQLSWLRPGDNILAVHALNLAADDLDLLAAPTLIGRDVGEEARLFFTEPTPQAANQAGYLGFVGDTHFSNDRGFYQQPTLVNVTTDTPGAEIYYTTDGSEPTPENGILFTDPLFIDTTTVLRAAAYQAGLLPSNIDTQTYLFLDQVKDQANLIEGYPTQWAGVPADYEMDPDVVGPNNLFGDRYRNSLAQDLQTLPSISLALPMEDMFGSSGIYQNPQATGLAWERATSVEFMLPEDPNGGFHLNSGVRVQGGSSRSPDYPKHSFRLEFRDEYGQGKLQYPLFADEPYGDSAVDEFDEIVLRAAFNNSWTHWHYYQTYRGQYVRDQWVRDLQLAMNRPGTHGRYAHLYINGIYWGLYNVGERPAGTHQAAYFGGQNTDYDVINSNQSIDGDLVAWNGMMAIANAGVASDQAYANLRQYLDVDGFIDYMLLNFYIGNADWDGHNWIASRKREPGAQFQFYAWDSEFAIALPPSNTAIDVDGENQILNFNRTTLNGNNRPSRIFQQLKANEEFRIRLADRAYELFFHDGLLTPDSARAVWDDRADQVDRAVVAESARWGDYRRDVHSNNWPQSNFELYTRDEHYLAQQAFIRERYLPARTDIVLAQLRSSGAFPSVAAPEFNQREGQVSPGFGLSLTAAVGDIYVTLDGSDPRLPGGAIAASAVRFSEDIVLAETTSVKARVLLNNQWSAVNEALFLLRSPASADNLVVREINYNPYPPTAEELAANAQADKDDFEFLELENVSADPIDLTGVHFQSGIEFEFSGNGLSTLNPSEQLVLVRDLAAFALRYPGVSNIAGVYRGSLSNGGETLSLYDHRGEPIQSFSYDDEGSWPGRADGSGSSLELIDPSDPADGDHWAPSRLYGGSPGNAGIGDFADVVINEVLSHTDPPQLDSIELFNTTNADIDIGGWLLSDSSNDYRKFAIPADTLLPGGGYLVFDESDFNASGGQNLLGFALDGAHGDDVWLLEADPDQRLIRFADHVDFPAAANGESFGRWPNGSGKLYPLQSVTLGGLNSDPRIGPLLISEVNYHPQSALEDDRLLEYVEIHNPTELAVDVGQWRLSAGIDFEFSLGTLVPPHGVLVVVGFDPDAPENQQALADFSAKYGVDPMTLVFGEFSGRLDNGGESIGLFRPDTPPVDEPDFLPMLVVDEIRFDDQPPWPVAADGAGLTLHRQLPALPGDLASSWYGFTPSPGRVATAPFVAGVAFNAHMMDPPSLPAGPQPSSWQLQRSSLQRVEVTFSEPVQLSASDLQLTNLGIDDARDEDVIVPLTDELLSLQGNILTIDLTAVEVGGGALRLEILPSVNDFQGNALDGDANGAAGDSFVLTGNRDNRFYTLAADFNGDLGVSIFDFPVFAYWFGRVVPDAPAYVDLNGDGGVTIFDFPVFAQSFGVGIVLPLSFAPALEDAQPIIPPPTANGAKRLAEGASIVQSRPPAPTWGGGEAFWPLRRQLAARPLRPRQGPSLESLDAFFEALASDRP